ncbi:MAG: hypothetical protein ACLFVU_09020 [Phycisphaerae bacterium]
MMNLKKLAVGICAAVVLVGSVGVFADAVSEKNNAQAKLLAARAARADAIRKLAERIKGLKITSSTTVKDFVTESDDIQTSLRAFLSGMKEVGKPKHLEDGTCELTMEVTLEEVVFHLKQIRKTVYKGDKFRTIDFDQITTQNKIKTIRVLGMGAQPEAFTEQPLVPSQPGASTFSRLGSSARRYWARHCSGRGRLMAERAARVDAMRRLAERIKGVRVTSQTTVKDFVAESDDVNVDMRTFLRGAKEIGVRYHDDELIVEVEMQVTLRTVFAALETWAKTHYKGDKAVVREMENVTVKTKDTVIKETGMGVPPEKYLKDATQEMVEVTMLAKKAPNWATADLTVTGEAALDDADTNKARAKLMAYRAAELDARRKLAERIQGLEIASSTSVQDFVAQSDQIQTAMLTFQQGAYVVDGSRELSDDGTAQVKVTIELKPLWNMILHYKQQLDINIR